MSDMMAGYRPQTGHSSALIPLDANGLNPGALLARYYAPPDLKIGAPLVVVLHGCTQNAAGFDRGTGWTKLADRGGFVVLFPEQTRANNPNLCFNWFVPGDIGRTGGEAESIAGMVAQLVADHGLDSNRVYITGLSAGGAMAAVMLAAYPEVFVGGAIIGGLPYGSATGVPQALERMRGQGQATDAALEQVVRKVSGDHRGPWPTVSIWHGTADATVAIANMDGLGRQWRAIHGVSGAQPRVESGTGWEHRSWAGSKDKPVVEEWSITGMGHGVPLDPRGADALGQTGAFMLDAGIASTAIIAHSWGLIDAPQAKRAPSTVPAASRQVPAPRAPLRGIPAQAAPSSGGPAGVQQVIEDALRAAGLMR